MRHGPDPEESPAGFFLCAVFNQLELNTLYSPSYVFTVVCLCVFSVGFSSDKPFRVYWLNAVEHSFIEYTCYSLG